MEAEDLTCPITLQIMKNPILCTDGKYYEKDALLEYQKKSNLSPITREKFEIVTTQQEMVKKINDFLDDNSEYKDDQYKEYYPPSINNIFKNKENYFTAFEEWLSKPENEIYKFIN